MNSLELVVASTCFLFLACAIWTGVFLRHRRLNLSNFTGVFLRSHAWGVFLTGVYLLIHIINHAELVPSVDVVFVCTVIITVVTALIGLLHVVQTRESL